MLKLMYPIMTLPGRNWSLISINTNLLSAFSPSLNACRRLISLTVPPLIIFLSSSKFSPKGIPEITPLALLPLPTIFLSAISFLHMLCSLTALSLCPAFLHFKNRLPSLNTLANFSISKCLPQTICQRDQTH